MLFLYRPPQTYMPYRVRRPTPQRAYNRELQAKFRASTPVHERASGPAATTNSARAVTLDRAIRAAIEPGPADAHELFTDDVRAWTPAFSASSLVELTEQFDQRDEAVSDVAVDVTPLDVGGNRACAEWTATMTHSGALSLGDGHVVEPTGLQIVLQGVAVADFDGDRICALRQYWDELSLFEQLGLLPVAE